MSEFEALKRQTGESYVSSPALQGFRRRAYLQGEASGLRGTDKDVARARWLKRWKDKLESLCWRDWEEGHDWGTYRRTGVYLRSRE